MAKVRKVLGASAQEFSGTDTYTSGRGATSTRAVYNLPKREAALMVMSESTAIQAKVYDRMVALEDQSKAPVSIAKP